MAITEIVQKNLTILKKNNEYFLNIFRIINIMCGTFSKDEIQRFDRIDNCLENVKCRKALKLYLEKKLQSPALTASLILWQEALNAKCWDESHMSSMIADVDGFRSELLSRMTSDDEKIRYIKDECCRLLKDVYSVFIKYLENNHVIIN